MRPVLLIIPCLILSCQKRDLRDVDPSEVRRAINQANSQYINAYEKGQSALIASLYASVRTGSLVELCITAVFWIVFYLQLHNKAILVWAAIHLVEIMRTLIWVAPA